MDHLSRISIFIEVARNESFAGAARALGITSSAVSKQIQNLEHELKVKLLNRTTRKVSLTEEGALFFERASRALEDLHEATEALNELKSKPHGTLKISAPRAFSNMYLKQPIADFAVKYPEVTIDVSFDDRIINYGDENFDVLIRIGALEDSSMIARKMADVPICAFASPEYLARHGTPLTPQDLAQHNVLAYTRNKGAHEWRYIAPDGQEAVQSLNSTFKADAAEMMVEAACRGIGITICPAFFVRDEIANGALVQILDEYVTSPPRSLYAIFPPNRYLSTRVRLFIDHIDAHCSAHLKH